MGLFRRGTSSRTAEDVQDMDTDTEAGKSPDEVDGPDAAVAAGGSAAQVSGGASREDGPWDADEDVPAGSRVDLGAIRLPGVRGMELRMEVDKASSTVTAAAVSLDGSTLQLQAFAAPRTEGIWDEIRAEIAESVTKQGGSVDDVPGPFGRELLARLPVRTPEGRTGHRPARFVGVDGPRWFLRGVLTGRAAVDPEAAKALEDVFRRTVVSRDNQARAPRDLLSLRLPGQSGPAPIVPVAAAQPSFDPLSPGHEITGVH